MTPEETINVTMEEQPDLPASIPFKRAKKQKASATKDTDSPPKKSRSNNILGPLPATREEASPTDSMIIRMKEKEGKSWAAINEVLEGIFNTKFSISTAQMRYSRMKANFVVFKEGDTPALQQAKTEVEKMIETEKEKLEAGKWQKISDIVKDKTGTNYPSSVVQKKVKELARGNGSVC